MDRTCNTCAYMVEKQEKGFFGRISTDMYCLRLGHNGQHCSTARHDGNSPYARWVGVCGPTGTLWEPKKTPKSEVR